MEALTLKEPESVSWTYDKEADVLYIAFGEPQPSLSLDLGGGLLARYLKDSGVVTGLTIVGVSEMTRTHE